MANTDWTKPTTATNYIQVLEELKDLSKLGSTLMRVDNDPTNGPDPDAGAFEGSIKWSVSNNRFQKRVGSGWADLTATYNINVATIGGQTLAQIRDITKLVGTLPSASFDQNSHGSLMGGALHAPASSSTNGFMSAVDKGKLNSLSNKTDAQIADAYHREVSVMNPTDLTGTDTKTNTPANLSAWIDNKLKDGVWAVTFKPIYTSGTTLIDVKRGQYQELDVTSNTAITFKEYSNNPYTMYLYITPHGNTVTVPTGASHRWSGGAQPAPIESASGIDLLTINYDGKGNFFYMLLADMR